MDTALRRPRCEHCHRTPEEVMALEKEFKEDGADDDDVDMCSQFWDHQERCLREKRLRLKEELKIADDVYNIFMNDGYCVDESELPHC